MCRARVCMTHLTEITEICYMPMHTMNYNTICVVKVCRARLARCAADGI